MVLIVESGSADKAVEMLQRSSTGPREFDPVRSSRTFRLNMSDLAESLLMPEILRRVLGEAPGLGWQSVTVSRDEMAASLARGDIDIAVDAPLVVDSQLEHVPLLSDRYVCAFRPGHPLARQEELSLEDYLALGHIHVSSRRQGLGIVDTALRKMGLQRRIVMWSPHYLAAPLQVLQNDLALTLPYRAARQYELDIRELPLAVPNLDFHLYWHRKLDNDPAHRWLRDLLLSLREDLDV